MANPTPELGIQTTCPEELTCLAVVAALKDEGSDDDRPNPTPDGDGTTPIGNCVISQASGEVPSNLYTNTGVVRTN